MADTVHLKEPKFRIRRLIICTGIGLVLYGYWLLDIPPETEARVAIDRAFNGMKSVIAGAILSLGAIFCDILFRE